MRPEPFSKKNKVLVYMMYIYTTVFMKGGGGDGEREGFIINET
jgi:hypothetical protein